MIKKTLMAVINAKNNIRTFSCPLFDTNEFNFSPPKHQIGWRISWQVKNPPAINDVLSRALASGFVNVLNAVITMAHAFGFRGCNISPVRKFAW